MTAKAFNGRIITSWLRHCLEDAVQCGRFPNHERLHVASLAMNLGILLTESFRSAYIGQKRQLNLTFELVS